MRRGRDEAMITRTERPTRPQPRLPSPTGSDEARRAMPAGKVLVVFVLCLVLWGLLDAQALKRSAEVAPPGVRRTAALVVLTPLAGLNSLLGLSHVERFVEDALGRSPGDSSGGLVKNLLPPKVSVPPTTPPTAPSTSGPTSSPGGGIAPPGVHPLRKPTKANHLRVLVVGDSVGEDLGIGLQRKLARNPLVDVFSAAQQSTGLARLDYFDWPAAVKVDVSRFHPDVVVAMFGANDTQSFIARDQLFRFGTPAWSSEYRTRIARLLDLAQVEGAHIAWVGQPIMGSPTRSHQMSELNKLYRGELVGRDDVLYVPSWGLFTNAEGQYSAYLTNSNGNEQLMRQQDGVHLTIAGDDRIASYVVAQMHEAWGFPRPK